MKAHKILNIAALAAAIFVIIGVYTFAHVCGDMGEMEAKCHATRAFAVTLSVILGILSLGQLAIDIKNSKLILSIVQVVGGILLALSPVIKPVCDMKTMHCYVTTRPFLIIVGIVITAVYLVDILIVTKKA